MWGKGMFLFLAAEMLFLLFAYEVKYIELGQNVIGTGFGHKQ